MAAKKYIVEAIGTFFLVLTIGLTAGKTELAPLAIGAVLMVMVYAGGFVSGAHYNPAATIAVMLRKKISAVHGAIYIVAQIVGAILALIASGYLVGDFAGVIPDGVSAGQAFVAELLFTFALIYTILHTAASKQVDGNSYFGLAIGFVVMVGAFAVGPISGGAFNPAVSLAPMLTGADSMNLIGIYLGAQ